MTENPIQPCSQLKEWVSALADGTLSGFARLYMRLHMLHCRRCRMAMAALSALCLRLRALGGRSAINTELTPERRSTLKDRLDQIDQGSG